MKWVHIHIVFAGILLFVASFFAFGNPSSVGFSVSDFFLQAAPVMTNPILNSTYGANFTTENLTCYTNATDSDGDPVTYRGFWYRNGKPYFYYWINKTGRAGPTNSQPITGVAVDSFDNIAATGSIDVVGKASEFFVVKYDENGTQLWNVSGGGTRSESAEGVAIDSQNNIIAAGTFGNVTTLQNDVWIWKLNASGSFLWNVTVGNPSRPDQAWDVAVDSVNNITVVGYNETIGTSGGRSIYIWKYNASGSQLWTRTLRAPGRNSSEAYAVTIDSDNNITITGYMFFSSVGSPVSQVFTAKLDPLGNQIKNVTFNNSGTTSNEGGDVAIDSQDNIIVVGSSGFNSVPLAIIIKYDSNLMHQWNRTINLTGDPVFGDSAAGVAIDDEDNIYVTGTTNRSIFLLKYDTNGNQLWNLTSSYDPVSQGRAIAIDSKNYIIIGGRDVNGSNDLGFVLKYYGFENPGQTQGVIVNSSTIDSSVTEVGDVWMCDSRALDATSKTTYLQSNNLTIRDAVPSTVECSINVPNNFSNCTNLLFFDTITQVRANCSGAVNATFNLTNLFDNTNFIYATTTTASGDFMVLDNSDVQVLDSGNWSLNAFCDYGTIQGNDTANFLIPFGNVTATMLTGSQNVNNGTAFVVTTRMQCVGGECVNNSVVLDPIVFSTNLTDAANAVQAVYADSDFIYAASEDTNLYIYNKTDLTLYATLSDSNPLQAVYADSKYIYAGGTGNILRIWNRTDYSTPFASVYNFTFNRAVISIITDNYTVYVGLKYNWMGTTPLLRILNKTSPSFTNFRNLSDSSDTVRDLAIDNTSLYAGTHPGLEGYTKAFVYNLSNLSQNNRNVSVCSGCSIKSVDVDDTYLYATGNDFGTSFFYVFYKSNLSLVYSSTNDAVGDIIAGAVGSDSFVYVGGPEASYSNGFIRQINKTGYAILDQYNTSGYWPKSLYCDELYLYAGMMDNGYSLGMLSLFNNPCIPVPVIITSSVVPSVIPVPSSAYCTANISTNGTLDNVTMTLTYPNGTVVSLNFTNASGNYNSSSFNVDVTGTFICNITANNTVRNVGNSLLTFYGGQKGAIPMGAGSPFYTTSQNPRDGTQQSCLQSLIPGVNCDSSWSVVPNGPVGNTYLFFATYNSNLNTNMINVTITSAPVPPSPGGAGAGGGSNTLVDIPEVKAPVPPCVEDWACGSWTECVGGVKKRVCFDSNHCNTEKLKPKDSEKCTVPEVKVVEKSIPPIEGVIVREEKPSFKPATNTESAVAKMIASILGVTGILLFLFAVIYRKPEPAVVISKPPEKFEFRTVIEEKPARHRKKRITTVK